MNQKLLVTFAVLAGFGGGVLSQYVSPMLVHAQTSPLRVNAQSFNLVDKTGANFGGMEVDGFGKVRLSVKDAETGDVFYFDPVNVVKSRPSFVPRPAHK